MLTLFPRPSRSSVKPSEPEPVTPAPEPPVAEPIADSVAESADAPPEILAAALPAVAEAIAETTAENQTAEQVVAEPPLAETLPAEPVASDVADVGSATRDVAVSDSVAVESAALEVIDIETDVVELPATADVIPETPSVMHPAEESPVVEESTAVEESIAVGAMPPEALAAESLASESADVAETIAESHSSELVAPEGDEIEWGPAESAEIEPAAIESATIDLPAEDTPGHVEAASEPPAVEHPVEGGSGPEESVVSEESIVTEEAVVAEHAATEANVSDAEGLHADVLLLDRAIAVEEGAREISVSEAEIPADRKEAPAVLLGTRVDSASSGSGFLDLPRVAEPEVMDDAEEVEAYASASAQAWLNKIDDSFVEHAEQVVKGRQRGRALDIGTGPGRILLKLALRLSLWKFIGVDRSHKMIEEALSNLAATAPVTGRLEFHVADGNRLDYPDASFDLVVCNSVLHHFVEPQNLLAEIARLAKPRGAILLRDLRRPSRLKYPFHVRWHGRRYSGKMNKLYRDSVCAAYTVPELQRMLDASPLRGARVFRHGNTHIGIERPYNW